MKKTGEIKLAGDPCTEAEKTWEWQATASPTGLCVIASNLSLDAEAANPDCSKFDTKSTCVAWKGICDYYGHYEDKTERCKSFSHRLDDDFRCADAAKATFEAASRCAWKEIPFFSKKAGCYANN